MRYIKKIICIVLMLSVLTALLLGCNNNKNNNREAKPDLHEAMLDYQARDQKRSLFEGEFKVTFFQKEDNKPVPQSISQKLILDRIQNQEKIYIDATLGTSFISQGFMSYLKAIISALSIFSEEDVEMNEEIERYLNGQTEFRGLLGFDGQDTYNAKGDYVERGITPDYKDALGNPFWLSVDEMSIMNLMYNFGISGGFSPKDYLMFSSMIDLSPSEEWIKRDDADKFFSDEEEAYIYAITTYGAKLRALIMEIADESKERVDPDEYQNELQQYANIFPTVMSWISVPDTTVDAKVNKDGSLKSFSSTMGLDLNIKVSELKSILLMLIEDIPDLNNGDFKFILNLAIIGMNALLTSASGQEGIWTIRFELTTDETFYYDQSSIDLSDKDQEMFIPNDQDQEGRFEIIIDANEE